MSHPCPMPRCDLPAGEWRLCRSHADKLERNLAEVPAWADQLRITLSRQTASGGRNGGRGNERPLAYDVRASEVLGELKGVLVGWVRDLVESGHGETPADTVEACALFLLARIGALRVHPAAEDVASEIGAAVANAVRAIDRAPVRVYAGPCNAEVEVGDLAVVEEVAECGSDLYARADATEVTCPGCGAVYDVADRREWMLESLNEEAFPVREIARLAARLGGDLFSDTSVTERRLNVWVHRETIKPVGVDPHGRPTYPLMVVMDLLNEKFGKPRADGQAVA